MARRGRLRRLGYLDQLESVDPVRHAELVELRRTSPNDYRRQITRIAKKMNWKEAEEDTPYPGRETDPALRIGPTATGDEASRAIAQIVTNAEADKQRAQAEAERVAARDAEIAADLAQQATARERVKSSVGGAKVAEPEPEAEAEVPVEAPAKKKPSPKKKKSE